MTSGVTAEAASAQLPFLPLGVEVSEGGLESGAKAAPEGLSARTRRPPANPAAG